MLARPKPFQLLVYERNLDALEQTRDWLVSYSTLERLKLETSVSRRSPYARLRTMVSSRFASMPASQVKSI